MADTTSAVTIFERQRSVPLPELGEPVRRTGWLAVEPRTPMRECFSTRTTDDR
jgi:hypothetical protein